ncbi:MAG TPA: ECF transporter S component [Candidatus Limnocylindrales bacterium]|jgi:energy-coupling factor transport system substrate-specific component|nr:ECF transporter S component [Candidatus Limnocylindrales bacterium]
MNTTSHVTGTFADRRPPDRQWRTRDILVVAVIAVAFGVFFWAFGVAWRALEGLGPLLNVLYGFWLLPAIVAPLIVRKPGAALFAELVAASLSAILGASWGIDVLVSGLLQGGAAELVFAAFAYRRYTVPVLVLAALASAAAAFVHDWLVWYPAYSSDALLLIALFMGISALVLIPAAALALVGALRRAGVLEGFPA